MGRSEPRFLECVDCRFYSKTRVLPLCLRCGAGENFEEKQDHREPTDAELMEIYRKMDHDSE